MVTPGKAILRIRRKRLSRLLPALLAWAAPLWVACLATLLVPPAAIHAQNRVAVTATASVDNPEPAPGDMLIYTIRIKIQGAQMSLGNIPAPKVPANMASTSLQPVGKSESFEIINGAVSQSTDYRFAFQAGKEGEYEIPAQELIFQNERIPVNAVKLRIARTAVPANLPSELKDLVVPPSAPGNPELAKNLAGALFILPMLSSTKIYEGQQLILSYHLVWDPSQFQRAGLRTDTMFVEGVEVPPFNQFVKEITHPLPRSLADVRRERVFGNRTYTVATLYEVALTPTRTGKVEIEPARLALQIPLVRRGAAAPMDPFANDPFFADDPIFGSLSARMGAGSRVRLIANSPTLSVDVLPVPTQNRPADWKGAVGHFQVVSQLDRTTATAGQDIVRLDVTVEGQGDAAGLSAPDLDLPAGLRLLEDPKATARTRRENDQPIQSKTFSYLLRPEQPGTIAVPPVALSVFEPGTASYRRIESDPLSIDVLPGSAPTAAVTIALPPGSANVTDIPTPTGAPAKPEVLPDLRFLPNHPPRLSRQIPGPGIIAMLVLFPPLFAGLLIGMVRNSNAREAAYLAALKPEWKSVHAKARGLAQGTWPDNITALAELLRTDLAKLLGVETSRATSQELIEAWERYLPADDPSLENRLKAMRRILDEADSLRYARAGTSAPQVDWTQLVDQVFETTPGESHHAHA